VKRKFWLREKHSPLLFLKENGNSLHVNKIVENNKMHRVEE
jgi:hypothetical protein